MKSELPRATSWSAAVRCLYVLCLLVQQGVIGVLCTLLCVLMRDALCRYFGLFGHWFRGSMVFGTSAVCCIASSA
jgi:hypothetical protein